MPSGAVGPIRRLKLACNVVDHIRRNRPELFHKTASARCSQRRLMTRGMPWAICGQCLKLSVRRLETCIEPRSQTSLRIMHPSRDTRLRLAAQGDALAQLRNSGTLVFFQFRLSGQHDLQQLFRRRLQVCKKSDLFRTGNVKFALRRYQDCGLRRYRSRSHLFSSSTLALERESHGISNRTG